MYCCFPYCFVLFFFPSTLHAYTSGISSLTDARIMYNVFLVSSTGALYGMLLANVLRKRVSSVGAAEQLRVRHAVGKANGVYLICCACYLFVFHVLFRYPSRENQ